MSLRNRLLALSLLTLLLPWSGWVLLQELERFLREAQENALVSTAQALAGTLPFESQSLLLYSPERYIVVRPLDTVPVLDGFSDDWPDAKHGLQRSFANGDITVRLLAGTADSSLFLHFDVQIAGSRVKQSAGQAASRVELLLRSPRGLLRFDIHPEAPGPLQLHSESDDGQAEGYWLDTADGYRVELALPAYTHHADLGFSFSAAGATSPAMSLNGTPQWFQLVGEWADVSSVLAGSLPEAARAWVVDMNGWVLADSGPQTESVPQHTTWVQRLFYRLVAGNRTAMELAVTEPQFKLSSPALTEALSGQTGKSWSQDEDTAVLRNSVAVPVWLNGQIRGAIVLQSASEGLLLVTNRALSRLMIITLALTLGLAGGLWYFATRLSRRVQRLSAAVSAAMEDGAVIAGLPLTSDRDELGELARNNAKLLRAVADYNQYLQTLAGKLSHELKTPLAITRSSLDNLSCRPLDDEARRFLLRAQEGVERQAAIVRAMSEANRLEASIRVAQWEQIDVAQLVVKCAESYRSVHSGRRIETNISAAHAHLRCAPELLVQALDKLVDNAISLSREPDVVSLSVQRHEGELQLAVSNTGTRLPVELQDRIFDSLVSLREDRSASPHLGLGLYIVRLVAAAHGGSVTARSLPQDQGVEFAIHLPVSN